MTVETAAVTAPGRVEAVLARLGARLGLSVGQTYTVVTGAVLALVLGLLGIPPVLDAVPGAEAASLAPVDVPATAGDGEPVAPPDGAGVLPPSLAPFVPGGSGQPLPDLGADGGGLTDGTLPPAPPTTTPTTVPPAPGTTSAVATVPAPGAPSGIAVAADGTIYVATDNAVTRGESGPSKVFAFSPAGRLLRTWTITGQPATRSRGLTGVAVDGRGRVWVLDASTARVLRLDPANGDLAVVGIVPDVRPCLLAPAPCEPGLGDARPEPRGIVIRADGTALVADRAQGIVWAVTPAGGISRYLGVEDRVAGEGPVGVGLAADGAVILAVSARLGALGAPSVLRVPVVNGTPGAPVVVADLASGEVPGGLAVGASGRAYVPVPSANVVLDVGIDQGDVVRYDGDGATPAFDAPTGAALRDGALLITNQSTLATAPDHWVVFALTIADRPVAP